MTEEKERNWNLLQEDMKLALEHLRRAEEELSKAMVTVVGLEHLFRDLAAFLADRERREQ